MYSEEMSFIKDLIVTSFRIYGEYDVTISDKGLFDRVTNVDRAIEEYICQKIHEKYPGDMIHAEEFSSEVLLSARTWILDPIDGTYNFSTGSDHFGIQIALWAENELQMSVIYLPKKNELYEAMRGRGAQCNGIRLQVSERTAENAIFAFGDYPHKRPDDAIEMYRIVGRAIQRIAKMRMFGAACIDFTMLASGKTEGVLLFTKNKWDIAPGLLLAKEAGAYLFGFDGEEYSFNSRCIFACNKKELFDLLMKD